MTTRIVNPMEEPETPAAAAAPTGKKTTSEAQLRANRENAQKSTGPKTEAGKDASRRNANKHGLYQEIPQPIGQGPFAEDADDFDRRVAEINESLAPRDGLEAFLCGQIVVEATRSRRLGRVEGVLLAGSGSNTSPDYDAVKKELELAIVLLEYLKDPQRSEPGPWRTELIDFIDRHTDYWNPPPISDRGRTSLPERLNEVIRNQWKDEKSAKEWAEAQRSDLQSQLDAMSKWDEERVAEDLVRRLDTLGAISTRATRNLQRLLVEYRRARERVIESDVNEPDESEI
jgi:hypothetical protein